MSTLTIAAALFAQSAFSLALEPEVKTVEAGYEQLDSNDPRAAIAAIEKSGAHLGNEPAALINLGNAWARLGQNERAMQFYKAALESEERHELELSDGSWMDSRKAARQAIRALRLTTVQAMAE